MPRPWSHAIVTLSASAIALTTTACRHEGRPAPAAHAPDSDLVRAEVPGSAPFHAFTLRRRFTTEVHGGGGGHGMWGGGGGSRWEGYRWSLEPDAGAPGRTEVVQAIALDHASSLVADDPTRWRLSAAPDGHAVAYSFDRGATWGVLALDLVEPWVHFAPRSVASTAGGPWSALEDSPTLAIHAFEAGVVDPLGVDRSAHPSVGLLAEILPSFCRGDRPADVRLAEAAARLFIHRVNATAIDYQNLAFPGQVCLARVVEASPTLRATMRVELGRTRSYERELAGWLLSRTDDPEDQEALARAIGEPVPPDADVPSAGHERSSLTWSLARSAAHRGDAPGSAIAALSAIALGDQPLPYVSWNVVRVHAVRGLAAVATDPIAHATLVRIAEGSCRKPLPAFPAVFEYLGETDLDANGYELPCWAQATLPSDKPAAPK